MTNWPSLRGEQPPPMLIELINETSYNIWNDCTLQVADTLLLVYRAGEAISAHSSLLLDCLMAQGLPTTIHIAQVSL